MSRSGVDLVDLLRKFKVRGDLSRVRGRAAFLVETRYGSLRARVAGGVGDKGLSLWLLLSGDSPGEEWRVEPGNFMCEDSVLRFERKRTGEWSIVSGNVAFRRLFRDDTAFGLAEEAGRDFTKSFSNRSLGGGPSSDWIEHLSDGPFFQDLIEVEALMPDISRLYLRCGEPELVRFRRGESALRLKMTAVMRFLKGVQVLYISMRQPGTLSSWTSVRLEPEHLTCGERFFTAAWGCSRVPGRGRIMDRLGLIRRFAEKTLRDWVIVSNPSEENPRRVSSWVFVRSARGWRQLLGTRVFSDGVAIPDFISGGSFQESSPGAAADLSVFFKRKVVAGILGGSR